MNDPNLSFIATIGLALGAAWVSGVRLYACVATLGWLAHFHYMTLPGTMSVIENPVVIWVATALFVVEFFADKIPWLDSGWHAVHTFLSIPAGAILASTAFGHYQPWVIVVAFLIGGSVAATAHAGKATTRAVMNMSPEPVSNVATSLIGDVSAPIVLALAVWWPLVAIVVIAILVLVTWFVAKKFLKLAQFLGKKMHPKAA